MIVSCRFNAARNVSKPKRNIRNDEKYNKTSNFNERFGEMKQGIFRYRLLFRISPCFMFVVQNDSSIQTVYMIQLKCQASVLVLYLFFRVESLQSVACVHFCVVRDLRDGAMHFALNK